MLRPADAGNASSWLIFQVSQHPDVAAKIRQELADLGLLATPEQPQPRQLEWADLAKLQYLNCCIKVSDAAHCPHHAQCPNGALSHCSYAGLMLLIMPSAAPKEMKAEMLNPDQRHPSRLQEG